MPEIFDVGDTIESTTAAVESVGTRAIASSLQCVPFDQDAGRDRRCEGAVAVEFNDVTVLDAYPRAAIDHDNIEFYRGL